MRSETISEVDFLIVGGGINGAAIARDAAGRGFRVLLVEQGDLAQHTSSASTKLIHGGLRYLETFEFRLVREALREREIMLRTAPHLISPLRFVMPVERSIRPGWQVRLGLLLYDVLGGTDVSLPRTRRIRLAGSGLNDVLEPEYRSAFEYSDARVDDARLVVSNLVDAARGGASVLTRHSLVRAARAGLLWTATISPGGGGDSFEVQTRALINAAGPWVGQVLRRLDIRPTRSMRLVKGSHIVVDRLYDDPRAFILQNADRRVVFAIPYLGAYTLVGTTEVASPEEPVAMSASEAEVDYLCNAINRYFRRKIGPADARFSYAGVRPLFDDEANTDSSVSRDYVLDLVASGGAAPLLSVYGGKITTARRLAEQAIDRLAALLGEQRAAWTADSPLPGGSFADLDALIAESRLRWSRLSRSMIERMVRAYGTDIERVLEGVRTASDLGANFGEDLTESEVRYLVHHEWAQTADDILWRRSKLGMKVSLEAARRLTAFLASMNPKTGPVFPPR